MQTILGIFYINTDRNAVLDRPASKGRAKSCQ